MNLDSATISRIESELPNLSRMGSEVLSLSPDFISTAFEPDSRVPIGAPCLEDAYHVACEARYALFQAKPSLVWYRRMASDPDEASAVWHARFYSTAAASCLYAAAEDLASAIVEMLEIDRAELVTEGRAQASLQVRVGKFLRQNMPDEPLTAPVYKLAGSESWRKAMHWRNRWVHEQSQVRGLGIVYDRGLAQILIFNVCV